MVHKNRILWFSLTFAVIFCISTSTKSQIDSSSLFREIEVHYFSGTVAPHEKPLNPLRKGIIKAFEVSYSFRNINTEPFPKVGISYLFMDLGYPKVLGYAHCFYPYISFPFNRYNNSVSFNLKVALGLSYTTKVYDSITNPLNIAISSPINLYASLGFEVDFKISDRLDASIGLSGSHLSNGAIKKPNYGLNILTGNIGICYNLTQKTIIKKRLDEYEIGKSRYLLIIGGGIKEANKPGGSKYGVGSLSVEFSKPYKAYFRYGASLDYMYDGSTIKHFRDDSVKYNSDLKASKVGVTIMGKMNLNRLSAFANLGVYIFNHDKQNDLLYQKIGLLYRMSKSFYSQIALKTHMNVADYIEFGFAINL